MQTMINNFVNNDPIEVSSSDTDLSLQKYGGLVKIIQRAGAMSFQHTMTCAQARQMAAALIACADESSAAAEQAEAA